jgi:hypothetical protein
MGGGGGGAVGPWHAGPWHPGPWLALALLPPPLLDSGGNGVMWDHGIGDHDIRDHDIWDHRPLRLACPPGIARPQREMDHTCISISLMDIHA